MQNNNQPHANMRFPFRGPIPFHAARMAGNYLGMPSAPRPFFPFVPRPILKFDRPIPNAARNLCHVDDSTDPPRGPAPTNVTWTKTPCMNVEVQDRRPSHHVAGNLPNLYMGHPQAGLSLDARGCPDGFRAVMGGPGQPGGMALPSSAKLYGFLILPAWAVVDVRGLADEVAQQYSASAWAKYYASQTGPGDVRNVANGVTLWPNAVIAPPVSVMASLNAGLIPDACEPGAVPIMPEAWRSSPHAITVLPDTLMGLFGSPTSMLEASKLMPDILKLLPRGTDQPPSMLLPASQQGSSGSVGLFPVAYLCLWLTITETMAENGRPGLPIYQLLPEYHIFQAHPPFTLTGSKTVNCAKLVPLFSAKSNFFQHTFCEAFQHRLLSNEWQTIPVEKVPSNMPVPPLERTMRATLDVKLRFFCNTCGNHWMSLKGCLAWWIDRECIFYKLCGQKCLKCMDILGANRVSYLYPVWYQEEVNKVVKSFVELISYVYLTCGKNLPSRNNTNIPSGPHINDACEACALGLCLRQ